MNETTPFNLNAEAEAAGLPMNGQAEPEVLDWHALCDRCMGNLDLVQRVLDKFEQRLPSELAELEQVLQQGDAAKIALVAHRIKGSSSNVSAGGLQKAAEEIEDLSRAGQLADIPQRMPGLRDHWLRYVNCRATARTPLAMRGAALGCEAARGAAS